MDVGEGGTNLMHLQCAVRDTQRAKGTHRSSGRFPQDAVDV